MKLSFTYGNIETLLKIIAIVIIVALILFPVYTLACIDPSSKYAVEVVLNKPGIRYNLTSLEKVANESIMKIDSSVYQFKYRIYYVYDSAKTFVEKIEFLVILYEAKFSNGVPYIEDLTVGSIEYYLGIRVEPITFNTIVNQTEDYLYMLRSVLKDVLHYLTEKDVIVGLTINDISKIVSIAKPGLAGWNSRLIYLNTLGTWAPYYELVSKGLITGVLLRGNTCVIKTSIDVASIETLKPLLNTSVTAHSFPTSLPTSSPHIPVPLPTPSIYTITPSITTSYPIYTEASVTGTNPPPTASSPPQQSTVTITTSAFVETSASIKITIMQQSKSYNGILVAISILTGVIVATIVYLYISKHWFS